MSYFSPKSNWLSMTEEPALLFHRHGDLNRIKYLRDLNRSKRPVLEEKTLSKNRPLAVQVWISQTPIHTQAIKTKGNEKSKGLPRETRKLKLLKTALQVHHEHFVYHKNQESGAELFYAYLRMARAQKESEEALVYYCHARHVAKVLFEGGEKVFLIPWLETNLIIAQIQKMRACFESLEMYVMEALKVIRTYKNDQQLQANLTPLALYFFQLLGRHSL